MSTFQNISKAAMLKELLWHFNQDRIIQGAYGKRGDDFRGCHVGSVANSVTRANGYELPLNGHKQQAEYLYGDDSCEWFVKLCEKVFEGLSITKSKSWVIDSFAAIPEGIPYQLLNSIEIPIKIWVLESTKKTHNNKNVLSATDSVISALRSGDGEGLRKARKTADAASADAAYAAYAANAASAAAEPAAVTDAYYAAAAANAASATTAAVYYANANAAAVYYAANAASARVEFYVDLSEFIILQLKEINK